MDQAFGLRTFLLFIIIVYRLEGRMLALMTVHSPALRFCEKPNLPAIRTYLGSG